MSLDNIDLTPFLTAQLFKDFLVDFSATKKKSEASPTSFLNILGNKTAKVVIVVEEEEESLFLPNDHLNFLLGVLYACNLTIKDVAIINLRKNANVTYSEIELQLTAEKILLFGVTAAQIGLPLQFPLYQMQQYNKRIYLAAGTLKQVEKNSSDKAKLWHCLKQIFSS